MNLLQFSKSVSISVLIAGLLTGCAHTVFFGRSLDTTTFALAAGADKPVHLTVCEMPERRSLGHQYLFVLFPFGTLDLGNPSTYLQRRAYAGLSLAGWRPITEPSTSPHAPILQVCLSDASLTAYDLLFLRRASGTVTLTLTYSQGDRTRTVTAEATHKMYVKFAFKDRLEEILNKATDAAFEDGLRQLALSFPLSQNPP